MRKRSWRSRLLIAILAMVLGIVLTCEMPMSEVCAAGTGKVTVTAKDSYQKAFAVLDIVNKERASAGLGALAMDKELLDVAMLRAHEVSICFNHVRPNGEQCFSASELMFGENIAAGYTTANSVMSGWMNSSGHRSNIMSEKYSSIGIGAAVIGNKYYWVQCFGYDSLEAVSKSSYSDKTVKADVSFDSSIVSPKLVYSPSSVQSGGTVGASLVFDNGFSKTTGTAKDIIFKSSNTSVCTVDGNGTVKGVNVGTAKISLLSGSQTISTAQITVGPKGTSISKLSAGKKKIKVKWKKQTAGSPGYQIQYSTNSKFKSGKKTITVSKNKTTSKTLTKLKAKKKYYVRIRTYKTINGKKVYSSWSKAKSIKTK